MTFWDRWRQITQHGQRLGQVDLLARLPQPTFYEEALKDAIKRPALGRLAGEQQPQRFVNRRQGPVALRRKQGVDSGDVANADLEFLGPQGEEELLEKDGVHGGSQRFGGGLGIG